MDENRRFTDQEIHQSWEVACQELYGIPYIQVSHDPDKQFGEETQWRMLGEIWALARKNRGYVQGKQYLSLKGIAPSSDVRTYFNFGRIGELELPWNRIVNIMNTANGKIRSKIGNPFQSQQWIS